ncbi:recombination repair protein 1 [Rhagoletis pomonella]|uniref:recombination repair protein 1 n=1 Tax=Rhagoletis pomonella TaxID=28610 RepID=UPI001785BF3D|nr:recombination repair protein 1 [Rhagoletis pomonella]
MAKFAKPAGGQKSLENVNEEAVVSSSSGFLSGEEDAVVSLKGKGRGRKAKREVVKEVEVLPATGKSVKVAKAGGTGRGRKKVVAAEEKEQATTSNSVEEAVIEKKSAAPKRRGRKAAESATVDSEPVAAENLDAESEVAKAPAKRGRKAAATKVEPAASESNGVDSAPPATVNKGRGRGKKVAATAATAIKETTAIQSLTEEPTTLRKQNKSTKEIAVAEDQQNGEVPKEAVKDTKKKITKESKVKVEQTDASDSKAPGLDENKPRSRGRAVKEEHEQDQPSEILEKSLEKPVKKAASKRKGNKKESVIENLAQANELELDVKAEEEVNPSPKKKSKKEPKENKTKATKIRARADKTPEKEAGEQLENNIKETSKKPQGRKRGATKTDISDGVEEVDGSKPAKAKKTEGALINSTVTKYNSEDFKLPQGEEGAERFNLKISSWNVAGLRSWLKKDGLAFLDYELPDIFCLQEIKCTTDQLPEEVARIPGYHPYWLCMPGGYAGVAIYSKIMPINVEYGIGNTEFDAVGRIITAEYEKFFLINVYVPNSGRKLVNLEARMRWEKLFQEYIKRLDIIKPVVICGDMNVSHQAIDLANPKTNTRNAGFTQEERDKMTELLALGFVDTFRHLYPDRTAAYTYWTYMANARSRNVGWRLDYFIVSERFTKRVVENCMRSQVMGSDHCPITLFLKM